jgi:hypothetical protein
VAGRSSGYAGVLDRKRLTISELLTSDKRSPAQAGRNSDVHAAAKLGREFTKFGIASPSAKHLGAGPGKCASHVDPKRALREESCEGPFPRISNRMPGSIDVLDEDDFVASLVVDYVVHRLARNQHPEAARAQVLRFPNIHVSHRLPGRIRDGRVFEV